MSRLAIIIPAFKSNFLDKALISIANQTNKDFTLYIGDDCSPGNLYDIVKQYESRINIVYKYFKENLGGINLISQWDRCIDLTGDEEWLWLFSDDDMMDPTCVENFYSTLKKNPDFDLFHFNVTRIDQDQNIIDNFYTFPEVMTTEDFLLKKLQSGYFSTVVEYIFRRTHFNEQGGFQKFDMAWGSDDATWIKLGRKKGIKTIEDSKVYWRKSLINISAIKTDREIVVKKLNAQIEFAKWAFEGSEHGDIKIKASILQQRLEEWFVRAVQSKVEILPFGTIASLLKRFNTAISKRKSPVNKLLFLYFYKIYRIIISMCRSLIFRDSLRLKNQKIQSSLVSI